MPDYSPALFAAVVAAISAHPNVGDTTAARMIAEDVLEVAVPAVREDERERCARLAEQHDARYSKPVYTPAATIPPTVNLTVVSAPFADLLRKEA